jgi:hypothetical protein
LTGAGRFVATRTGARAFWLHLPAPALETAARTPAAGSTTHDELPTALASGLRFPACRSAMDRAVVAAASLAAWEVSD